MVLKTGLFQKKFNFLLCVNFVLQTTPKFHVICGLEMYIIFVNNYFIHNYFAMTTLTLLDNEQFRKQVITFTEHTFNNIIMIQANYFSVYMHHI